MADEIKWDFTEVDQLAAVLNEVPKAIGPFLNSAIQFTSVEIKKEAKATVKASSKRWKRLPTTIDYTVSTFRGFGSSVIKSEIGYNKSIAPSARLGDVREFGAPAQNTAPGNDLANALEKNQADFQHGIERAVEDAERKAGL